MYGATAYGTSGIGVERAFGKVSDCRRGGGEVVAHYNVKISPVDAG